MARYELIEKYPGSPALGYVTGDIPNTRQWIHEKRFSMYSTDITDSPKHWRVYNDVKEEPKPILVTEDGIDIFPGDTWYYVKLSTLQVKSTKTLVYNGRGDLKSEVLRFSTAANALIFVQAVNMFSTRGCPSVILENKTFTAWECIKWANFTKNRQLGTDAISMEPLIKIRDGKL
jgi:hypothetical protein